MAVVWGQLGPALPHPFDLGERPLLCEVCKAGCYSRCEL